MKKNVLGRGLSAILPPASAGKAEVEAPLLELPLSAIEPNPRQPRKGVAASDLEELSSSIRSYGILQPVVVTPLGAGKYQLIAGERRFHAAKRAGLSKIPVMVRKTEQENVKLLLALVENLQRRDLTPIEEARAYAELVADFKLSHEDLAAKLGKSRPAVTNILRLLSLPAEIQEALHQEKVTPGQVRPLLGLDPAAARELFRKLMTESASARDMEAAAAAKKKKRPPAPGTGLEKFKAVQDRLMRLWGRKVELHGSLARGQVRMSWHSQEDLLNLVDRLIGTRP